MTTDEEARLSKLWAAYHRKDEGDQDAILLTMFIAGRHDGVLEDELDAFLKWVHLIRTQVVMMEMIVAGLATGGFDVATSELTIFKPDVDRAEKLQETLNRIRKSLQLP